MKLFVSPTSPFARLVMITALQAKIDNLQLIFINPWNNPIELLQVNPFSQVPTLLTDEGNLITESMIIIAHLAPQVFKDERQTALISYAISTINQTVRAFGTKRFQPENSTPHPFIERSTGFLQNALPHSPKLQADSDEWGQIFWGLALVYLQMRLPNLYEQAVSADNKLAVTAFIQRDFMQKTATPHLENMAELAKQKPVMIGNL